MIRDLILAILIGAKDLNMISDLIFAIILMLLFRSQSKGEELIEDCIADFVRAIFWLAIFKLPFLIMIGGWRWPLSQDDYHHFYSGLFGFAVATCVLRFWKARANRRQKENEESSPSEQTK